MNSFLRQILALRVNMLFLKICRICKLRTTISMGTVFFLVICGNEIFRVSLMQ